MEYPVKRDLDGIYFRVCRDGKWQNVCMTDLSKEEFEDITADREFEWLESACGHLADLYTKVLGCANDSHEARIMLWSLIDMIRYYSDQMGLICECKTDE